MMERKNIEYRIGNLISVKSLVTLLLTVVFAWLAVHDDISEQFMTIYTVVISFYYGTQAAKG